MIPILLFVTLVLFFPQTSWSWNLDLASTPPDISYEGSDRGDHLGTSIARGDLNGDGFKDLIIGVMAGDGTDNNRQGAGEVYIYFGKSGLPEYIPTNPPDVIIYGSKGNNQDNQDKSHLGYAITTGKVNNDSYDDLIIAAPFEDGQNGKDSGVVYIIFGKESFPLSEDIDLSNQADIIIHGERQDDFLGCSVATGKINNDNYQDILVGSRFSKVSDSAPKSGAVFVLYGSDSLSGTRNLKTNPADFTIYGGDKGDQLGCHVSAGDINDDNIDDIVVGAALADGPNDSRTDSGEVYVVFGGQSFNSTIDLSQDLSQTNPNLKFVTIYGVNAWDKLGLSTAIGKVNKDNFGDIIIGAPFGDGPLSNNRPDAGEVYVIPGGSNMVSEIDLSTPGTAFLIIYGASENNIIGSCKSDVLVDGQTVYCGVVSSGDFNKDGYADILIGAPEATDPNGENGEGVAYLIYGGQTPPSTWDLATLPADGTIHGAGTGDDLGNAVLVNEGSLFLGAYLAGKTSDPDYDYGKVYGLYFDKDNDVYSPFGSPSDCDDSNSLINPGATEVCNGIDDNCNVEIDEGLQKNTYYQDTDGDTYGNLSSTTQACTVPSGYVTNNTDCNDSSLSIYPGATEFCNGIDDDCDGFRDEDYVDLGDACYKGIGACKTEGVWVCTANEKDKMCNAPQPGNPATEVCNGIDDDCDGTKDEDVDVSDSNACTNDTCDKGSDVHTHVPIDDSNACTIDSCNPLTGAITHTLIDTYGNQCDADEDDDGIPDTWEVAHGLDPHDSWDADKDHDGDGESNLDEYKADTNPFDTDSGMHFKLPEGYNQWPWILFTGDVSILVLSAQAGDEAAAVNSEGTVCGRSTVTAEGTYGPMFVYGGDDPETKDIREGCLSEGENIFFRLWHASAQKEYQVNITVQNGINPPAWLLPSSEDRKDAYVVDLSADNETQAPLPPASTSSEVAQSPDDSAEDTTGNTSGKGSNKKAGGGGGACFIATAAYGSYLDPHVVILRNFRDQVLLTNPMGRVLVDVYYMYSPSLADFIREHESIRTVTRWILTPVVYGIKYPEAVAVFIFLLSGGIFGTLIGVVVKRKQK